MRGLFLNVPMTGHINPTLAFVRELVEGGDEIFYYCTEEYRSKIAATGATFCAYDFPIAEINPAKEPTLPILGAHFLGMSLQILDRYLAEWRALDLDYIITDSCLLAGPIAASKLGVRGVTSTTTFVLLESMLYKNASPLEVFKVLFSDVAGWRSWWRQKLDCRRRYGFSPALFDAVTVPQDLNLVYTSRHFQPMADELDPSVHRFLGPLLRDETGAYDFPLPDLQGRKLVYASLGTTYNAKPQFFKKCIEALAGWDDVFVILSVGKNVRMEDLVVPERNFLVRQSVPQLEVLKRADLFITHGGMNSVNEAMYFGVPVLVFPQQGEQKMVGERVAALGAGINTKMKEPDPSTMRQLVEHILQAPAYRQAARAIGDSFRQAEGARGGMRAIHQYVQSGAEARSDKARQPGRLYENA